MATYQIMNSETVINTIHADQAFIDAHYPGARLVAEPLPPPLAPDPAEGSRLYVAMMNRRADVLQLTDPSAANAIRLTLLQRGNQNVENRI